MQMMSVETDQIIKAIIAVQQECPNLAKEQQVGTGRSAYKSVNDQQVRNNVRPLMSKHGLSVMVQEVETITSEVHRYIDPEWKKAKKEVFEQNLYTFRLSHVSGQWMLGKSKGIGVDGNDKGPGKAETYAMKNFLMNTFLITKGDDEDPSNKHSKDQEVAPPLKKVMDSGHVRKLSTVLSEKFEAGETRFSLLYNMLNSFETQDEGVLQELLKTLGVNLD